MRSMNAASESAWQPSQRAVRVAMVTNIPAPYRLPTYELLADFPGIELTVIFCSGREPDREWDLQRLRVPHVFLRERVLAWKGRYIHANPDVWSRLRALEPEAIITTGFNPTHLIAFAFARLYRVRHIAMTDGTAVSESRLSALHHWLRRLVYRRSHAFIGAGEGSFALYRQYGVPESSLYQSHLCANNPVFAATTAPQRDIDLIFCGRFAAGKLPLFAIEVAEQVARRLGRRVVLLLVGSGELNAQMRQAVDQASRWIDARFAGFARQSELPAHYARSRLLLFPTAGDTWGVVANEACAAGVPVIVSPQAGVAGDLVRDGENGRVLALDVGLWADAAATLLFDDAAWRRMSQRALELVQPYTYANAAAGVAAAVAHAVDKKVRA
jgi:glycosyltransferase involved in cell wall biosynthesis